MAPTTRRTNERAASSHTQRRIAVFWIALHVSVHVYHVTLPAVSPQSSLWGPRNFTPTKTAKFVQYREDEVL